ncbi:MAG: hypothetical protein GQF41_1667 [Candidatus Rifleibacterium amylolyticum]|nr:MAG: hypothetical protein GQF41_1667 [Candidatus Rifleibacterium amylolyticum]
MVTGLEAVLKDAMQLDPVDRAELLNRLFFSFSSIYDATFEKKWKKEVKDRVAAYDAGKITADSSENVFKRLAKR